MIALARFLPRTHCRAVAGPAVSAVLLMSLAACETLPVLNKPDVPEQPVIETAANDEFDYATFERRREAASESGPHTARELPDGTVDPTFPLALGDTVALLEDPAMTQRLSVALAGLLEHWPHQAPDVGVVVTDDPSFSPAATPGGTIAIPRGFLENTRSLDELHFVLAHELSHVLLDHFRDADRQEQVKRFASRASEKTRELETEFRPHSDPDEPQASELVDTTSIGVLLGNQYIFGPVFNRRQEIKADQLGLDLAVRAGFGYQGAYQVIQRMMSLHEQAREEFEARCGSIDPYFVDKALGAVPDAWRSISGRQDEGEEDPACIASQNALEAMFDQRTHPDPEQRWEAIQEYVDVVYADVSLTRLRHESENNLISLISPNGTLARSSQAQRALEELERGNLAEAERLAYASLDGAGDPTPRPRWAMYKVRRAQYVETGEASYLPRAITNLEIAAEGGYAPRRIFLVLAEEYAGLSRFDDAVAALREAAAKFNDPETYYPREIRYLGLAGAEDELEQALQRCIETGNDQLVGRCRSEAQSARA